MTKDEKSHPTAAASQPLNPESQTLLEALTKLTEAMLTNTRGGPPPHADAVAAAEEYRQIKAALQTHSESFITYSKRAQVARKS